MHALISGGGIAGAVAAMALQKVGVEATIFERHPRTDSDIGSYFTITANGLEALGCIDAREMALEAGFPTRHNVLWNHAGRRLARLPLDSRVAGSPFAHTMKRSRLARLLQDEAIRRGIPVEYGRRLTDAAPTPEDQVLASLEDGGSATGDLLIGADGVHSSVRRLIDPGAPSGRYVGLVNFGGWTRGAADGIEPEAWHLVFGRRAFFGYQTTPAGDVVWFANLPGPMVSATERASTDTATWKSRLIDFFVDDAGPAVGLIEAGELELAADNTHDLGHVPIWHRGPIVIIGDAAHAPAPTSGQGASMAIEDGVVLAQAIRDQPDLRTAFAEYEKVRRGRVEKIVAWGAQGSSHKTPGPLGRLARDIALPLLFRYVITEKSVAWMYDYRVDWTETTTHVKPRRG